MSIAIYHYQTNTNASFFAIGFFGLIQISKVNKAGCDMI